MVREKYKKGEKENFITVRIPRSLREELRQYKDATGLDLPAALSQALRISELTQLEGFHLISPEDFAEFQARQNWKGRYLMREIHRDHMAEVLGEVVAELGTQLAMMRAATEGVELGEPTEQAIKAESDQIQQEIEQYVADNMPDTE